MNDRTRIMPEKPLRRASFALLQRKCACGGPDGECVECRKEQLGMQRRPIYERELQRTVPPIVYEVLRAPGQPLDAETRAFMESHFGHDFGRVRVHTDPAAGESARVVNALAYTVGQHVVFGSGKYGPTTPEGKKLISHELAHTIQQAGSPERLNARECALAAPAIPTRRWLSVQRRRFPRNTRLRREKTPLMTLQ